MALIGMHVNRLLVEVRAEPPESQAQFMFDRLRERAAELDHVTKIGIDPHVAARLATEVGACALLILAPLADPEITG